jgi:hypothetical protein
MLLAHRALQTLVLVIDGSVVGRGCVAAIPAHSLATSSSDANNTICEGVDQPFCLDACRMVSKRGGMVG